MVEDSRSSDSSTNRSVEVDSIVKEIKLCYPEAVVNVEVLESDQRPYKSKNSSQLNNL